MGQETSIYQIEMLIPESYNIHNLKINIFIFIYIFINLPKSHCFNNCETNILISLMYFLQVWLQLMLTIIMFQLNIIYQMSDLKKDQSKSQKITWKWRFRISDGKTSIFILKIIKNYADTHKNFLVHVCGKNSLPKPEIDSVSLFFIDKINDTFIKLIMYRECSNINHVRTF